MFLSVYKGESFIRDRISDLAFQFILRYIHIQVRLDYRTYITLYVMFPNLNKILASTWHSVEAKYNLIDIIIVVITIIFL